ncbi:Probable RNA-directed DNA polymerase from transposon X-element [Eumeta japonica]|uniref:Probable RNA-directed DNA polymerase from transposon X-element n=1 Tax=Eumeta variegata TaxID=151549 RepID=A0A4C1VYP6_EUMVA|nr:Probable RNA-directed DNA polymerase from transposon X-element [Eumeta japonica]
MIYASLVFAHTGSSTLKKLQDLQKKFCRAATNAHWCVRNSVLHRNLDLPTITKYMKDASERFFFITEFHPNTLLSLAASSEPHPHITSSVGYGILLLIRLTTSQSRSKCSEK